MSRSDHGRESIAVIVGGSSGIGLAAAHLLAEQGRGLVVNGRDRARLADAGAQLRQAGHRVATVAGDASDPETGARLAQAAAELGEATILVTAAGGGIPGRTWDSITPEELDSSHRQNLATALVPIQAIAPTMVRNGFGRIVTVSSLAGRRYGRVSGPDYSAHKAGLIGLTRAIAAELGPTGVTVNCVAPGLIDTERAGRLLPRLPAGRPEAIIATTPIPRMGTPREVAAAIAFLASDDAGFITGHTLDVNGGAFMG